MHFKISSMIYLDFKTYFKFANWIHFGMLRPSFDEVEILGSTV